MFEILDGRKDFYQWDIDRKLIIKDENISQVHFCNKTGECSLVCDAYTENGKRLVDVPNILLQSDWKITVYAYDDNHTKYCDTFKVIRRSKPEDYVYTPEELKVWNELENRIEVIESSYATEEYVDKAISEIDITGFVKYDEAQELTNEQKAKARANIDSANAKATADALATKITTPTVATVGQAMVVKAVDEASKPIEWECANVGEKWRKLAEYTLEEDTVGNTWISISADMDGKPISASKLLFMMNVKLTGGDKNMYYKTCVNDNSNANYVAVVLLSNNARACVLSEYFDTASPTIRTTMVRNTNVNAPGASVSFNATNVRKMDGVHFMLQKDILAGTKYELYGVDNP